MDFNGVQDGINTYLSDNDLSNRTTNTNMSITNGQINKDFCFIVVSSLTYPLHEFKLGFLKKEQKSEF